MATTNELITNPHPHPHTLAASQDTPGNTNANGRRRRGGHGGGAGGPGRPPRTLGGEHPHPHEDGDGGGQTTTEGRPRRRRPAKPSPAPGPGGDDPNYSSTSTSNVNHRPHPQHAHDHGRFSQADSSLRDPTKHPQQQPTRKPRRRGGKFNADLTENPSPSTQGHAPVDQAPGEQYRNHAPKQDDLTSSLIHSLKVPPYRDCLICFSAIRPGEPIWSCSTLMPTAPGSDDEKAQGKGKDGEGGEREREGTQCCWTPFHLKCIKHWAGKSVKELADAWRARGEDKPGSWRCPGCQSKRLSVPGGYWCFCGSTADPRPPRLATPHSCAANCSRTRACGHACPLSCHPGPCPPCQITIQRPCFCGREIVSLRCAVATSQAQSHLLKEAFSCGRTCDRMLGCGNHRCKEACHEGACKACEVTEVAKCYCGKEEREVGCGEGESKVSVLRDGGVDGNGERRWVGRFACENECDRLYDCGVHRCAKPCHPQEATTSICPRSPALVTHCPCLKHSLSPESASAFPYGTKLIRTACTDPIPTCESTCMKPLSGCTHLCSSKCHSGPCPPCAIMLVRPCRCGATTQDVRCSEEHAGGPGEEKEILCTRTCTALRACGKHQCQRVCCPLASLAASAKGKGKKRAMMSAMAGPAVLEGMDEAGWHECDIVCGKVLGCGNHQCEEKDHRGPCKPCLRYSYEEMICYCGRTVLEPPIPCGTRIVCSYPCTRPSPPCGHQKAPHHCHETPQGCPPCVYLTQKKCACGKKMVGNVRCSQDTVSCGTPCGKLLECGFHHCERHCHSDGCGPCNAACGKPRKLCLPAIHPCTLPCHAPSACSEAEPCRAIVNITCPCGRIVQPVSCGRSPSNPGGREGSQQLNCTPECGIAKRNARLADALGISADRSDSRSQVVYAESVVAFGRGDPHFCAMVEKTFAEFVTSERKSQILPHMPPVRRKFVHDLASVYRMDTQMVDQEPKRSVELIRRIDTRIPTPTLSSTVASTPSASHSLGRLTDLRAPAALRLGVAGRSSNTSPAPSSLSASGSRAWTSIVAKAPTPAPPPTAPKLVGGASVSTSWRNNVNVAARAREVSLPRKVAATSSRLIQLPAPIPTPTPPAVISVPEIDVPDSWEDEA